MWTMKEYQKSLCTTNCMMLSWKVGRCLLRYKDKRKQNVNSFHFPLLSLGKWLLIVLSLWWKGIMIFERSCIKHLCITRQNIEHCSTISEVFTRSAVLCLLCCVGLKLGLKIIEDIKTSWKWWKTLHHIYTDTWYTISIIL